MRRVTDIPVDRSSGLCLHVQTESDVKLVQIDSWFHTPQHREYKHADLLLWNPTSMVIVECKRSLLLVQRDGDPTAELMTALSQIAETVWILVGSDSLQNYAEIFSSLMKMHQPRSFHALILVTRWRKRPFLSNTMIRRWIHSGAMFAHRCSRAMQLSPAFWRTLFQNLQILLLPPNHVFEGKGYRIWFTAEESSFHGGSPA